MFETQEQFWNEWAEAYQGFSEIIEPYQEAQRLLARSVVDALEENVHCETLHLLDVGGGAGNMVTPMLEIVAAQRSTLRGVTYVLTDGANAMVALANKRLNELRRSYPDVVFRVIHIDTLAPDFTESIGPGVADVVVSSWNVEYYPPQRRQEIATRLRQLVREQGVVAFSSIMRLPDELSLREVLMPLGSAQVVYALLTGGPRQMRRVITGLKQIAQFGVATGDGQFPEKPTLTELKELAEQVGFGSTLTEYHLYGVSGMVVARKGTMSLPELPKSPIAQALVGKEGYDNYPETVTFWSYLHLLLRGSQ